MEVVGAMVAGVVVDPGERNMRRRVVEGGRKEQPTSIIPHTSTTAGGGESGADLLSRFVLAVVSNPLCPADTQLCREESNGNERALQNPPNVNIGFVSFVHQQRPIWEKLQFCGSVNCQGVVPPPVKASRLAGAGVGVLTTPGDPNGVQGHQKKMQKGTPKVVLNQHKKIIC